ncbi:MAG: PEPxxWA-CTERM sorting domain-containing protein [Alphaproteobacteria bacterium]|nr:PEPxxWA-CTERM sorting domain-containing protein [Alphaproteobacteria bacterium]MBU1516698.1 PEPxxWA-CTERM sorting domain-containing protein [Alphaproteobacteria bacterium]MBU2094454.1 PEPxxWA-CTERM sorting domain-containing protein [Alphaproteobacteria bacterium]MBU2152681.1 PEPxxWA-CTERM sorting domain-containing protein [Alphaproteobacteria bacterium]MBU2306173.1 PEPxxWA-CTERM sorting domain-containing protein [Alphaproteobacteria bacterium]
MLLSSYSFTTYAEAGFNVQIVQAVDFGSGNTSIDTSYTKAGATSPTPRFQALSTTFVYDPSAQGEITTIDFSIDQLIQLTRNGAAVPLSALLPLRLLAEQDGKVYEAFANSSVLPVAGAFVSAGLTGLTAADFFFFNPATPNSARTLTGLDFAGGAIRFGFETTPYGVTLNGGASTGNIASTVRADNFSVTVNSRDVAAVPEPSTWAMMITGFGLAGAVVRRRRMAIA